MCAMSADQMNILTKNKTFLLQNLNIDLLFLGRLDEQGILTQDIKEELKKDTNITSKKIDIFLDYLPRQGRKAFEAFILALLKTNQTRIAEELDRKLAIEVAKKADLDITFEGYNTELCLESSPNYNPEVGWVRSVGFFDNGVVFSDFNQQVFRRYHEEAVFDDARIWHIATVPNSETQEYDNMIVARRDDKSVTFYKKSSGMLRRVGCFFAERGAPCRVAMSPKSSNILVRVLEYTQRNTFSLCGYTGLEWNWAWEGHKPDLTDVAVGPSGKSYLLGEREVYVIDDKGKECNRSRISLRAGMNPQDDYGTAICVDHLTEDIVVACASGRILLYNKQGTFLRQIANCDSDKPTSIALDRERGLIVGTENGLYHFEISPQ